MPAARTLSLCEYNIEKEGDKSMCKVMEHTIHSHLMNFFEEHDILTDYLHWFRKKISHESRLIGTTQDLAISIG
jgi:hypothetical protein